MEIDNTNSNSSFSTQNCQIISINDSESNDSNSSESDPLKKKTNIENASSQGSAPPNDQNVPDDSMIHELKKLSLDQNGTFMVDFDPEKSKREMRKMNRRLYIKGSKKAQMYDDRGILIDNSLDLCDCLDRECPGCHFPCARCSSSKCGVDCRCNRKYIIEVIEVEGTEAVYNFPELSS